MKEKQKRAERKKDGQILKEKERKSEREGGESVCMCVRERGGRESAASFSTSIWKKKSERRGYLSRDYCSAAFELAN